MGPFYVCLMVHDLLASMKSELTIGYLDDFSLGDEAGVVADNFVELEARARELDLASNRPKREVIGHTAETRAQLLARGAVVREVWAEDAILLGTPLLPGARVHAALTAKRKELHTLAKRLRTIICFYCATLSQQLDISIHSAQH